MSMGLKAKVAAAAGGAMVLAGAAGGIAYATTAGSSAAPAASAQLLGSARTAGGHLPAAGRPFLRHEVRMVLRHTVHAELIVRTKRGYETVEVDRGVVTSDSGATITIRRPDGPSVSATVTGSTRFVGLSRSQLVSGDRAILVQSGGDALLVASRPHPPLTAANGS